MVRQCRSRWFEPVERRVWMTECQLAENIGIGEVMGRSQSRKTWGVCEAGYGHVWTIAGMGNEQGICAGIQYDIIHLIPA